MESEESVNNEQRLSLINSQSPNISINMLKAASSAEFIENGRYECVKLIWNNVHYVIDNSSHFKRFTKKFRKNSNDKVEVIHNSSGVCQSDKVTAFLGPSGAGKTTLLECIAGRRTIGVTGQIYVTGAPRAKIAFCAQKDYHLSQLTIRETLMFASRLKNYRTVILKDGTKRQWTRKMHLDVVSSIIEQLGIDSCADVRIDGCSGGQIKRLTIGIELVSRPNILILDEPTSGLDSSSCLQCVKLMQQLARGVGKKPIAVVASLHQPSAQVLSYIDNLYIMSSSGRCIYNGPTIDLLEYLKNFELSCPMYQTPTDFTMEIASGDYGQEILQKMEDLQMQEIDFSIEIPSHGVTVKKIVEKMKNQKYPNFLHLWLLFYRTHLTTWRQPQLTSLRLFTNVTVAMMIAFCYKIPIGQFDGCNGSVISNFTFDNPILDHLLNIGFFFFSLIFIALSCQMPTILTFPLEMSVFLKERANGWYSCAIYYFAKSITDIPYQITFPLIYSLISYFATYQVIDFWRISIYNTVMILTALISQTVGLLIGAVFTFDLSSAVYAVALITAPLILFTGFLVRFNDMPNYILPLTYSSYLRFGIEAIMESNYGYGRCANDTLNININSNINSQTSLSAPDMKKLYQIAEYLTENNLMADVIWFMDQNFTAKFKAGESFILRIFDLNENSLYINIGILVIFLIALRIITYFVLLWKANKKI